LIFNRMSLMIER